MVSAAHFSSVPNFSANTCLAPAEARGRTVTLKLKHKDFTNLTRSRSLPTAIASEAELARIGHELLGEVLPLAQPVRLVGLTLSALEEDEPPAPVTATKGQAELPF